MHRRILAALLPKNFVRAIREDFVDVHVVRRPGSSLVHVDYKLVAMFSRKNFICRIHDCIGEIRVEPTRLLVSERSRALDSNYSVDERRQWLDAADWKILNSPQSLHAIQRVGRDFELSERILLDARFVSHCRALRIYEVAARTSRAVPFKNGLDIRSSP